MSGIGLLIRLDEFTAGWNDNGFRWFADPDGCDASGQHGTLVDAPYCVSFGQDEFGGYNILTDSSDVLPRCRGLVEFNLILGQKVDVLDHDHRVAVSYNFV